MILFAGGIIIMKVLGGASEKDRIEFHTKDNSVTAIRKGNGEIEIKFNDKDSDDSDIMTTLFAILIFVAPLVIKEVIIIPLIENQIIGFFWFFIPLLLYILLSVAVIACARYSGGTEMLKNHGAEHKVHNAYSKLSRLPTVEEAASFSRIHKYCGTTIFTSFITHQIIDFFLYSYFDASLLLRIAFLCLSFSPSFNLIGRFAQLFTTSKPEKQNIELAIATITALETLESSNSSDNVDDANN